MPGNDLRVLMYKGGPRPQEDRRLVIILPTCPLRLSAAAASLCVRDVGGLPSALHLEAGDETHEAGVLLGQIRQSGQAAQYSGHSVVINVIKSPHLQ